jgi:hypothetical protein
MMKKTLILTTLGIIAVTMTMPVLSTQFTSPEAAAEFAKQETRKWVVKAQEPTEADGGFLGRVFGMLYTNQVEDILKVTQKIITSEGLSSVEQLAEKLEDSLRKALSVLESTSKDETGDAYDINAYYAASTRVTIAVITTKVLHRRPETSALFEEYLQSKSARVRKLAMSVQESITFEIGVYEQLGKDDIALKAFILGAICNPSEPCKYLQQPSGWRPHNVRGIRRRRHPQRGALGHELQDEN